MGTPMIQTIFDPFASGRIEPVQVNRELLVSEAVECAAHLERRAIMAFFGRSKPVQDAIREYMVEHFKGADTTRLDFEEAVRYVIRDRWGV